MKFAEDHNEARFKITGYEAGGVGINGKIFNQSLILSPMEFIQEWEPKEYSALKESHLEQIYSLKPDVILLGTGMTQIFPKNEIMRKLVKENIGFEVMTTQAVCRTFNILMSEGRNVVAGIFIT